MHASRNLGTLTLRGMTWTSSNRIHKCLTCHDITTRPMPLPVIVVSIIAWCLISCCQYYNYNFVYNYSYNISWIYYYIYPPSSNSLFSSITYNCQAAHRQPRTVFPRLCWQEADGNGHYYYINSAAANIIHILLLYFTIRWIMNTPPATVHQASMHPTRNEIGTAKTYQFLRSNWQRKGNAKGTVCVSFVFQRKRNADFKPETPRRNQKTCVLEPLRPLYWVKSLRPLYWVKSVTVHFPMKTHSTPYVWFGMILAKLSV